jgi:hypothetical protein
MNRRGFLKSCLAAGTSAYVITTAGILMPVRTLASERANMWALAYVDGLHRRIPMRENVAWEAQGITRIYGVEREFPGLGVMRVKGGEGSIDLNFHLCESDTFTINPPPDGWFRLA